MDSKPPPVPPGQPSNPIQYTSWSTCFLFPIAACCCAIPYFTSFSSACGFLGGSSLPTSSSPHYSNGSHELPLHHPASVDESTFESPYVLFSAHKVLKRRKQANVSSLGFGALVSPGREVAPGPEVVQREPHRCQNCGAYANLYCEILIGSGQWQCVICKKLNSSDGEYIVPSKEDLLHIAELSSSAIDYVQAGDRRPGLIPVSDSRMLGPIFLVIDECLDEAHLQHLQGSLHAFVDSLPPLQELV
uniref:Protein transport protein SEC23 n=1 Tax=Ananas comosus var. bracteatus TaxID=296719 RepID=A0A6V7PFP6_ANACO|nr:unnamed protein product [Ananas comosus var. bracteatus]